MAREAIDRALAGIVSGLRSTQQQTPAGQEKSTSEVQTWERYAEYHRLFARTPHEEEKRPLLLNRMPREEIDRDVYGWAIVHDLSTLDRFKGFGGKISGAEWITRQPERGFWTNIDSKEIPKNLKKALGIKNQSGTIEIAFGFGWNHPQVRYLDSGGFRAAVGNIAHIYGHADIFVAAKDAENTLVIGSDIPARRLMGPELIEFTDGKYMVDGTIEKAEPQFSYEESKSMFTETAVLAAKCAEREFQTRQGS